MADATWKTLTDELDMWHSAGKTATFWWRDDDATQHTEQLEQLDQLSRHHRVPVSIAVIPAYLDQSLVDFVKTRQHINLLQHGYAHQSHAGKGVKKIEIGGQRDNSSIKDELSVGLKILKDAFEDQFIPVLVPPWNRIEARSYPVLQAVGFAGISSMWARKDSHPAPGLLQVNTHLDPVNWRQDRGFIDNHSAIGHLHLHLFCRRTGFVDTDEPTGILTHHLDQTADVWEFCDDLFERLNKHPAVSWLDAKTIWH